MRWSCAGRWLEASLTVSEICEMLDKHWVSKSVRSEPDIAVSLRRVISSCNAKLDFSSLLHAGIEYYRLTSFLMLKTTEELLVHTSSLCT